nr:5284_t:CDS:2 [Entrophospora candida]
MANVYTLQDINSKGHRLGSMREKELEEKLNFAINSIDETNDLSKKLLDKYFDQEKSIKRERKTWSLERKCLNHELTQNNNELQNLHTQALEFANIDKQLRNENANLISRITQKDRYLADSKAKIVAKANEIILLQGRINTLNGELDLFQKKMKEANYLQSRIKSLEEELFSAQNDSSLIKSEFLSLKSKLAELYQTKDKLEPTKDELSLKVGVERLKLVAILDILSVDEFKIPDISANNKPIMNLRKYLHKDIIYKNSKANTTKMPEPMKDMSPEGNVTPQVAKQINVPSGNIPNSSLNKSNSEISVGVIEAIPAMASVLGSPKIPWLMLTLLIIIVVSVRFIRPKLNANKKNETRDYTWTNN